MFIKLYFTPKICYNVKVNILYAQNVFKEDIMKIAIIGSRGLQVNIEQFIPLQYCDEIISGGARGIDTCAREFAQRHNIKLTEFLPDYNRYGRKAPLVRNKLIVEACDVVVAFWDGQSRGTMFTVNYAREIGKPVKLYKLRVRQN